MMMSERIKTDRREKICPYDLVNSPEIFASPFVYETLAFTIERQKKRLQIVSDSLISSAEDSPEQLQHLKRLWMLIVHDSRLADHLDSQVLFLLVRFLNDKKDSKLQLYSTTTIKHIVSSKKGSEIKDILIPYLLNLISSSNSLVQQQALTTLNEIATEYPNSCNAIINNKTLDLLESVLTSNKSNHYELLESGTGLLVAFCQMSPHLLSDKMQKVVGMISTAIEYRFSELVLMQVCIALSILSDQGFVKIGTAVIRLLDLIDHSSYYVVISALRTIGNYVRWGNDEDIQFMVERDLLLRLAKLLCHEYTIVRKEACWIISNITAVANNSQIQVVIDMGLIDTLVRLVRIDEFEVKEVAAHAISNVVSGSDKKQFTYLKENCFQLLDDLRFLYCRDDKWVVTLCTKILQLGNIRASMRCGTTADLASASAECAQRLEKITKKKNPRRCEKLSTAASPADPLTDLTGDLGSEVIVKVSLDSSMKDLDSKIIAGENKLEEAKKNFTAASLVNIIKPPRDVDSEEIVSREKPLSVDYTEDLCSKKLKKDKKLSSSTLLPDSFIDPIDSAGKITRGKKLLPDSSIDPINPAEEITSLKKLSTTASSSVNSTGNLDSVQIVSRVKHLSIDDSEDLGSKKLKKCNKLFTVASPESSIGSTNDLGSKKTTNKCNLNKATDNYSSRALKNKLKQGEKLSTTASEDNTVTKATIQELLDAEEGKGSCGSHARQPL